MTRHPAHAARPAAPQEDAMTTTTTTPASELRTAAQRLRCGHTFPVLPPAGSLAHPGPCKHCGMPHPADDEWIPERLREPLAALLDDIAGEAERHAAHGMGNAQDEVADSLILNVARAVNRSAA